MLIGAIHESSRLNCLLSSPTDLELVTVKISLDHLFLLCRVHLPSNSFPANDNKVIAYLDSIASASCIVFLGDFSFQISVGHHLEDPNLSPRPSVIRLCHNLIIQLVYFPTHCKGGILDLVFSSTEDLVNDDSLFPFGTLHCDGILFSFVIPTSCCPIFAQPTL